MDQIDIRAVENFFAETASEIYDVASRTVSELKMDDFIRGGVLVGLSGGAELTQKEVADALGISQSYISRLEKKIMSSLRKKIEEKI